MTMQWNPLGKPRDWGAKPIGGFEDIPESDWPKPCRHPQHEPPTHIVIPSGKRYRHICPGCDRELAIYPSEVYL